MRVLVVLPTFNEAATIENILDRVRKALPDASVLVVDDNSPDGTAKVAAEGRGEVRQCGRPVPAGQAGPRAARIGTGSGGASSEVTTAMVEMDSDFSHDPDALPTVVAPLGEGFEVCIGSRYVPGGSIPNWSLPRRLLSRRRQHLRRSRARPGRAGLDRRVQGVRGNGSSAHRLGLGPGGECQE